MVDVRWMSERFAAPLEVVRYTFVISCYKGECPLYIRYHAFLPTFQLSI